jgi:hypothetical protein
MNNIGSNNNLPIQQDPQNPSNKPVVARANQLIERAFNGDPNIQTFTASNESVDTLNSLASSGDSLKDLVKNGLDTIILDTDTSEALVFAEGNLIAEGAVINPELWDLLSRSHDNINFLQLSSEDRVEVEATFNVKFRALLDDYPESNKLQADPIKSKDYLEQADLPSSRQINRD